MIKKSKVTFKDGSTKTHILVVEGVRIGNKITKISSNNIEYTSMKKLEQATIEDIKLIFKMFKVAEYGKFTRIDKFETRLSRITYTK